MARIGKPHKGKKSVARVDPSDLFRIIQRGLLDDRIWARLAIVAVPDDASSSHFEVVIEGSTVKEVLVNVETAPEGEDIEASLGAVGGLWRVPALGAEVIVLMPSGKIDFKPTIIAIMDSPIATDKVDDQKTILVAPDEVWIQAPKIKLGPDPENIIETPGITQDSLVHGSGIDSFTGSAYSVLGNATTTIFGRK